MQQAQNEWLAPNNWNFGLTGSPELWCEMSPLVSMHFWTFLNLLQFFNILVYSTVGKSIADIRICPETRSVEVNIPPRSYIEAIDQPTVLYNYAIYYGKCATDVPFA